jgi:acetoacetyl-CoA synthetase
VPDQIRQVRAIPRTQNGKKLEVPIKRFLTGTPLSQALNIDTLSDPTALEDFANIFSGAAG